MQTTCERQGCATGKRMGLKTPSRALANVVFFKHFFYSPLSDYYYTEKIWSPHPTSPPPSDDRDLSLPSGRRVETRGADDDASQVSGMFFFFIFILLIIIIFLPLELHTTTMGMHQRMYKAASTRSRPTIGAKRHRPSLGSY